MLITTKSKTMGNYIALEGVKGVGKSTIYDRLTQHLTQQHIVFEQVCPTKKQEETMLERFYAKFPSEYLKEFIYAGRSNSAAEKAEWEKSLILGDRSIFTSYATRFWNYFTPNDTIKRVDALEYKIKAPNIVLYMNATENTILNRLDQRKDRTYGKEDEKLSKIRKDIAAYNELRYNQWSERTKNTKWIDIDCNGTIQDTLNQIVSLGLF